MISGEISKVIYFLAKKPTFDQRKVRLEETVVGNDGRLGYKNFFSIKIFFTEYSWEKKLRHQLLFFNQNVFKSVINTSKW